MAKPGRNYESAYTKKEFADYVSLFTPHSINFTPHELENAYQDFCLAEMTCLAEPMDYLKYGFFRIRQSHWNEFITRKQYAQICSKYNKAEDEHIISNKALFAAMYRDVLGREVEALSAANIDNVKSLCEKHELVVIKPVDGGYGRGIRVMSLNDDTEIQKLAEEDKYIIEEKIIQHDSLAILHPASVNTVRVVVLMTSKNEPKIISAVFRCGRGRAIVDNADGLFAAVDLSSGKIKTDAKTHYGEVFTHHPDTGIRFKGYQIPNWDDLILQVHKASRILPGIRVINWDFALRSDGLWTLIEGNTGGGIGPGQVAEGRGMRRIVERSMTNYESE